MAGMYADLDYAQDYFATCLHTDLWDASSPQNRQKALQTATRHIDRLAFAGEKNAAYLQRVALGKTCYTADDEKSIAEAGLTQELQFPRGSDTSVPVDIKIACCELAFKLLEGRKVDEEYEELAVVSRGFSSVRDTTDRSFVQEHLNAGIVSATAWWYLRPYLRGVGDLKISRVS